MLIDVVKDVEGVRFPWHIHIGRADSVPTLGDGRNLFMTQQKTRTLL